MKKNWVIIIILFLLAANAALFSTLILSNKKADTNPNRESSGRMMPRNLDAPPRNFERHLSEQLGLSEQQQNDIRKFRNDFHTQKHELLDKTEVLRKECYDQVSLNNPDTTFLKNSAQKFGDLYTQILLLDFEHYRNIRSVCNAEQARKLDSLGRTKIGLFINKRDIPEMQWRQKHDGNPPFNKRQRKFKNYENNKK